MSALFVGGSSKRLVNTTSPIIAPPFTIGMWVRSDTDNGIQSYWFLGDSTSTNNYWRFGLFVGLWTIVSAAGGAENNDTSGVATLGQWAFTVSRIISATSRRASILDFGGNITNLSATTSRSPVANTMALGATESSTPTDFASAAIGEFWITRTDVQPGGAAMQAPLLRQLAYGGPFSVPHVAKDIIEYRSLRVRPDSRGDSIGEVYHGAAGRQTWGNTNSVTTAAHPPLPYWYERPVQSFRSLTV